MAYTKTFATLSGQTLTVSVGGVTTSADLPLAAEPFETEEADDADVFLPIRTQSGYLRMLVADSAARTAWRSFIPTGATEKRVTLTDAQNTLLWQGYVQTGTYGMQYPADYEEFELPVQCPLSVLDAIDMDTTPPDGEGVLTFGKLLAYIFGKLTTAGTVINNYYFQGTTAAVSARLGLKVIYGNFLDTDQEGNIEAKYTCYEVLEEVCKFFGYSVRMCGDAVYFTCPAGGSTAFTEFTTLTGTGTAASASTFNISETMLASNDQQEEVEPGRKSITVKSDINKLDNIVEVPYDEIYDRYNTGEVHKMVWSVDYYDHDIYYAVCEPNTNNDSMTYENDEISMTLRTVNVTSDDSKIYGRFLVFDDEDVGDVSSSTIPESKMSYNWQKCIDIFHSYLTPAQNNTPKFTIESKQTFVISDGVLYVNFKCKWVSAWLEKLYAVAKLKVGNLWWVGTYYPEAVSGHTKGWEGQWQSTEGTFTLYFTADGALTTRQSINDPQYSGCGIPVTDTMRGTVHFEIVDVLPTTRMVYIPLNGFLSMQDFEIGFVRGSIEEKKYHGNEYTKQAGQFQGTDTIDLIFACDVEYGPDNYKRHMPAGLGYVLDNTHEKPSATIPSLTNTDVVAEEQLADIMAAYHNHTHRVVTLELLSNLLGNISPRQSSTGLETMHPLSISHSWRDDITRIKLIQI